jgi:4-amino-4-deoxy-L-arabinose transferase-like glycosyltransferase
LKGGGKRLNRRIGREWSLILGLLLLAFLLRTAELARVPPGLHNDEVVELQMTESVAGGRLEIFYPEETGHEALYYYLSAPLSKLFGLAPYAMRLPSAFVSMLSMCVIWAFTRRLLGPVVALTALAGFAISFWAVAFGRIISHVVLDVPLAALAAYCFWRAWAASGRRALLLWVLSGLWLGLAINAYTAARVLPAIIVAFGLLALVIDRRWGQRWAVGVAITLGVMALVVAPLFLYLMRNPGIDQLSFYEIDRPLTELRAGNLRPVIETSLKTLGMFAFTGDPLPYFNIPGRPLFEPIGASLFLVGLLISLWRWRQPHYAFLVVWLLLSLLPGMLSQPAPNSTRTLAVQVVVFAFPGIAIAAVLQRWPNRILYAGLAFLLAGNLAWTVRDYFVTWPNMETVRFWHQTGLKAVADRLQEEPDRSPVVICVPDHLIDEREPWWKPAWQHMRYLLPRTDLSLRYYNCADAMVLADGRARYAFPDMAEEDALYRFPIYGEILSKGQTDLDFLPNGAGVIVQADRDAAVNGAAVLDQLLQDLEADSEVQWAPEVVGGSQPARLPVDFQNVAEFLGYRLSDNSPEPGGSFELVTYWRVSAELPAQLALFTHLLDESGEIVTQQDRLALTSASLRPGDLFVQRHQLTVPPDLAPGSYPVTIGLYRLPDGTRLGIAQDGQGRGDRLWLRPVEIEG